MTLPVHVVAPESLLGVTPGTLVTVGGAEGRHAVKVRRLRVGEQLELVDGVGTRATAIVQEIPTSTDLIAEVVDVQREQPWPLSVVVVQALAKGDRSDTAVETLTEVGVDEIVPWEAERCVARWSGAKGSAGMAKWQRIAVESGKQSRRARFPIVSNLATTNDVLARIDDSALAVVLHEEATTTLSDITFPSEGEVVIVVGPEGGLSVGELDLFGAAQAVVVRLGPSVLRTSTAGTVAAGVIMSLTGRWSVQ